MKYESSPDIKPSKRNKNTSKCMAFLFAFSLGYMTHETFCWFNPPPFSKRICFYYILALISSFTRLQCIDVGFPFRSLADKYFLFVFGEMVIDVVNGNAKWSAMHVCSCSCGFVVSFVWLCLYYCKNFLKNFFSRGTEGW